MKNKAWLPNFVTLVNLILGFYAIILVIREQYVVSAFIIFICMILDGIDGRIARKVAVSNPIGKDLDSLADLISFGITPAILIYQVYLIEFGILGVVVATVVPVCGAIRLARFNVLDSEESIDYFKGLPITAGGGVLISFVLAGTSLPNELYILIATVTAILMISTIKYPNFKKATPFQLKFVVLYILGTLIATLNNPSSWLMVMLVGYVFLGLALHVSPIPKLTKLFYTS